MLGLDRRRGRHRRALRGADGRNHAGKTPTRRQWPGTWPLHLHAGRYSHQELCAADLSRAGGAGTRAHTDPWGACAPPRRSRERVSIARSSDNERFRIDRNYSSEGAPARAGSSAPATSMASRETASSKFFRRQERRTPTPVWISSKSSPRRATEGDCRARGTQQSGCAECRSPGRWRPGAGHRYSYGDRRLRVALQIPPVRLDPPPRVHSTSQRRSGAEPRSNGPSPDCPSSLEDWRFAPNPPPTPTGSFELRQRGRPHSRFGLYTMNARSPPATAPARRYRSFVQVPSTIRSPRSDMAAALQKIARARNLMRLAQDAAPSGNVGLDVQIVRYNSETSSGAQEVKYDSEGQTLVVGEWAAFRMTNKGDGSAGRYPPFPRQQLWNRVAVPAERSGNRQPDSADEASRRRCASR